VANDLSNADVANRLFLSEKTVERQLSSIFAKLNVLPLAGNCQL
jgi:DNA-binding NarL/FixJ family response regulator